MFIHPDIDPVALQIGPVSVRWYGLMYVLAFTLFVGLGRLRLERPNRPFAVKELDDLLVYGVLGVVLGGRLGYVLFYKPAAYLADPISVFKVWEGGMSFHGGLLGVALSLLLFAQRHRIAFLELTDFVVPLVPLGLAAGRLGNFINGELWGRVASAELPWAMIFPRANDGLARHPSQLYEFALEGIVLFCVLWLFSRKDRPRGQISALFLMCYGLFRFGVEFTREPDSFLGLLHLGLSMGQWLSLPMIIVGVWLWSNARLRHPGRLA